MSGLQILRQRLVDDLAMVDQLILEESPGSAAPVTPAAGALAWGAKVSAVFRDRVRWIAEDLDIGPAPGRPEPSWIMAWIAWETGRSFRADVKNMAGSGATGLIQFMPATAAALKTTVEALARMTPEDQLNFVWKYFEPFKGRIRSLADGYMAILWPSAVGQPASYVLFDANDAQHPARFRQNAGLDLNKDGRVTKDEASAKVEAILREGLSQGNAA